jgi:uncharacterized repeat protein (TIGR01451 family)
MRGSRLFTILSIISLLALNFAAVVPVHAAPNIDGTNKWAWSENGGWINFNPTGGAVEVTDTAINGHAWIANYGWINLQPPGSGVVNTTAGVLSGQAWGENTGYIDFAGVTIDSSGEFIGSASNTILGTISFNCVNSASCGSSDFKVETTWLPTAGGGGGGGATTQRRADEQADNEEPEQEVTILDSPPPTLVASEPISDTQVKYTWSLDNIVAQDGFRLYDGQGNLLAEINDPLATTFIESNLFANTLISGRTLTAFSADGETDLSSIFNSVTTFLPDLGALMIDRTLDTASFSIEPSVELTEGQTALQFEVLLNGETTINSGWTTDLFYTLTEISFSDEIQVRVMSRNSAGHESDWSAYTLYEGFEEVPADLSIGLSFSTVSGNPIQDGLGLEEVIQGVITVENTSEVMADNVFVSLPLSVHLSFVPGSLVISGNIQSDGADSDTGQFGNNQISAVWGQQGPGERVSVSFQVRLNQASLRTFSEELVRAQVVLGPQISLQASVSASNLPLTRHSNSVSFAPDVETLLPEVAPPIPVVPEPPVEPAPIEPILPTTPPPTELEPTDEPTETPELILTGSAESQDDRIEFTGTTSEPNSTITVIINEFVVVTVTSDSNGNWTTYVSAQELGLNSGESQNIVVEAFAVSNDGKESNRLVQNIFVDMTQGGEVIAEPIVEAEASSNAIIETFNESREQVAVILEEREEEIQITLVVTAPVVLVSSAPLWGYLPYLPTLTSHLFFWVFGLFRRKSKQGRLYGQAYDSITKEPVALSIIRIFQQVDEVKKLVTTIVTDKHGRYEALLKPGDYIIEVKKPQYKFPSNLVEAEIDGDYQHVSHGQFTLDNTTIGLPDLPLDPENAGKRFKLANVFKKAWLALQKAGHFLAIPILFVGAIGGGIVLYNDPTNPLNWVLTIVYIVMLVLQLNLREHIAKAWGIVYDIASGAALPLVTLQLIDPEFGKVVKSRLSDYEGRFSFLPEPGQYVIKASKEGYNQAEVVEGAGDLKPISGEIQISKVGDVVDGDVAMSAG